MNHIERATPSTGSSTPANAPTSRDHDPGATDDGVRRDAARGVSTPTMRPPSTTMPVAAQLCLIVAPDADA